jgi:hypothetical protein
MNLPRLARISALCLIVFMTALTAFALPQGTPPCRCQLCSHSDPLRACRLEGEVTTCGLFLAVALCPARPPADSTSSVEASFLSLTSEAQEPVICMDLGD